MLLSLLLPAVAGDLALYTRAVALLQEHYLHPEVLNSTLMFQEAGRSLEDSVEWLLVDAAGDTLSLRDGQGRWTASVRLEGDLPAALSRLEDAVATAGIPLDEDVVLRVEILRGVFKPLDRHSVVLHAAGLERFDERLNGTLSGIGATIGIDSAPVASAGNTRRLVVKDLFLDGPASRAGLRVGDYLLKIGGISTVGMTSTDATHLIRGEPGSLVELTVARGEEILTFGLTRKELTIPNVEASVAPGGVGVVTIDHFSEQTQLYLDRALAELSERGALEEGLIIDLRGNTGGSLIQSARAVDTFVDSGLIVATLGRDGETVPGLVPRIEARPQSPVWSMPIAVLMDHSTASGSEILAGALSELDRAILLGQNSFGKGTVQKVYPIAPDIKVKVTVAEYLVEGELRVADVGLPPDLLMAPVVFEEEGVWFADPERELRNLPSGTPLLPYAEEVQGEEGERRDATLEVAEMVLKASGGGSRGETLAAAERLQEVLAAAEDRRLVDAFRARGIDWSSGGPASATPWQPQVTVDFEPEDAPVAGEDVVVGIALSNKGPALHRASIRLSSDNRYWDDLVVPLGVVPSGATVRGKTTVSLPVGLSGRADAVTASLEAEGFSRRALSTRTFSIEGRQVPPLAVTAALGADGRVICTFENRSDVALTAVRARFSFPESAGIELLDFSTPLVDIAPKRSAAVSLGLSVAETYTADTLPLELLVEAKGIERLLRMDLSIPRDGHLVRWEAPSVSVKSVPNTLPVGMASLHIKGSDDVAVDHLVVYAGPETVDRRRAEPSVVFRRDKVAWQPGAGRKLETTVRVPVVAGTNHFVVAVEDDQGLRTSRDVYVLGVADAAADGGI